MQINYKIADNVAYVFMQGELDESVSLYCNKTLTDIFNEDVFRKVIFDLSELTFMDSTGIGVLIKHYKKLESNNIKIYICNPNKQIEKIFKMSGLYEIMPKIG